jgi:hypothetical protein
LVRAAVWCSSVFKYQKKPIDVNNETLAGSASASATRVETLNLVCGKCARNV